MNEAGYLVIVVTNQPVVARGEVTEEELAGIHNKMETLLGLEGAYLGYDVSFCERIYGSNVYGQSMKDAGKRRGGRFFFESTSRNIQGRTCLFMPL